jgi:serralysin
VRAAGIDPLAHYMTHGWREVRLAGLDPLSHYLQHGYLEGRQTFGDGSWA